LRYKGEEDMIINKITWMIGGVAGAGIMAAGTAFAKACARGGLWVFVENEYPSLIKGGHNTSMVRVDEEEIFSHTKSVDLLVALNKETIILHQDELSTNGGILYDGDEIKVENDEVKRKDASLFSIPAAKLLEGSGLGKLMLNSLMVGASLGIVDYDFEILKDVLRDSFQKKGDKVIEENIRAAKLGFDYAKNYEDKFAHTLKRREEKERMLITGNDAICLGALKAGCKFVAAYPMTPASSILHYMASKEMEFNLVVKHTEDEISAINMIIGASYAGVRAMGATSGGGFSLMVEGLGLAAMSETPIVMVEAQRPGPSTGLPTRTAQGDLGFILSASQGDFLRIVIAPGDIEECFYETFNAFNLAEKFQVPVLIISDKFLAESPKTVYKFDEKDLKIDRGKLLSEEELERMEEYKRYLDTEDGVSPRAVPSQKNGIHLASSYEHAENSASLEDEQTVRSMVDKRFKKEEYIQNEIKTYFKFFGPQDAELTLVSWGSTKGPIFEAMKLLNQGKRKVNFLQIIYLSPFPSIKVKKILEQANKTMIVENNRTAQLAQLINEKTGKDVDYRCLKYDGRPFYPSKIYDKVMEVLR
jgi:2-oxoglutarate/2-oxoacid ferredoxin oxidoreductase subunit alpha